jgi:large subunit ribosomal protein L25
LFELKIEGVEDGEHTVVFKEVQLDPIKDHVLHVDFQKIRKGEELTADVSLHFTGDPVGVKAGGILQHYLREVTVQCLPKDLPDFIEVDISHLDIKDNLRISNLIVLEGVKYVNSPEEIVAAVTPKRVRDVASLIAEEELTEEKLAELVEMGEITAEQAAEVAEEREFGVAEAEAEEAPEEAPVEEEPPE